MRNSKLLLTSLLAAAAMGTSAYATTTVTVGDYTQAFDSITTGNTAPTSATPAWWLTGNGGKLEVKSTAQANVNNAGVVILGNGTYSTDGGDATAATATQLFLQGWGSPAAIDITSTLVLGANSGESNAALRFGADGNYDVKVSGDMILGADAKIIGGGTRGVISGGISGNRVLTITNMNSAFALAMTGATDKTISLSGLTISGNTTVNMNYKSASLGVLNLSGANAALSISGSENSYSAASLAGAGTLTIDSGVTFTLNNSATTAGTNQTFSGTLAGSGELKLTGGVQKLSAVTVANAINVAGGKLVLAGTNTLNGAVTVSGGTLDLSSATVTLASSIQNSGTVTVSSTAVFVLTDALKASGTENTWTLISGNTSGITGWDTLTASNFRISGATSSLRGSSADVSAAGQVAFTAGAGVAANLTWNAGASGTWDVQRTRSWRNDSTNADDIFYDYDNVTFATTGDVSVSVDSGGVTAGTVNISAGTVTFTGGKVTARDGFQIGGTGILKLDAADDILGTVTVNEGGKFELNGKTENLGANGISVVLNGGTLSNAVAVAENKRQLYGLTLTADSTVEAGGRFGLVGANYAAVALDLGGHTLTKTGDAAFVLTSTTVKNGTLSVTEGSVTDSDSGANRGISLTQGAAINVSGSGSANLKITSMAAGTSLTLAGTGTVSTISFTEATSLSGNLTIGNATVDVSSRTDIFNYSNNTTQNIELNEGGVLALGAHRQTFTNYVTFILNGGRITGDGSSDSHGYAMDFIKSNTVTVTADSEIAANMTIRRHNETGATLAFEVNDGATLTISGDILTPSSAAQDTNSVLVKQGKGTLVLSGTNTYNQGTRVEEGTVEVRNARGLGTDTVNLTGDATLQIGETSDRAALTVANNVAVASGKTLTLKSENDGNKLTGVISGAGSLKATYYASQNEALTLAGDNSFSGGLEVSGVKVSAEHANALGSGMLKISDVSVTYPDHGTITFGGSVNAAAANVVLHDVSLLANNSAQLTADASCNFTVAGGAVLYLDIGALTETVLTGEQVALTIAAASAFDNSFFSAVEVGTYGEDGSWVKDLQWAYVEGTWDNLTGTLSIAIPEPLVFGLLAGLGALALAGTRRRRRKA